MSILFKIKYLIKIILLISINSNVAFANINENKEDFLNPRDIQQNSKNINSDIEEYILGPGDKIYISIGKQLIDSVINLDEVGKQDALNLLSGDYEIAPDGTLFLPRINNIYVEGISLKELKELLISEYSQYLRFPEISLKMISYRDIRIFVDGEVAEPGYYTLTRKTTNIPTVYDALKQSGGININSDISNIEVIRNISMKNGGGKKRARLNLLKMINGISYSDNIKLQDGDIIKVNRSDEIVLEQIKKIIKTNITPKEISVFVLGRLTDPGQITLPKGSSLNEAILVGNPRVLKGKVEFIRLDKYKATDKRLFSYRPNAKEGSYNNPILMDGDIIRMKHNVVSASSEVIGEITTPVLGVYSLLKILE